MTKLKFNHFLIVAVVVALSSCTKSDTQTWAQISKTQCEDKNNQPATLFTASDIVTMDKKHPSADWVLVQCGLITGIGQGELPQSILELNPKINDRFARDVLMPGFIDPHLHPMIAAVLLPTHFIAPEDWDLPRGFEAGVKTRNAYLQKLQSKLAAAPKDKPFISWGWHELWHGPLTRDMLDEIDSTRPVIIWQRSFHEIVANTKGMKLLGAPDKVAFTALLDHPGVDPKHANFEQGYFSETALATAFRHLATVVMSPASLSAGFAEMKTMLRQNGITTISDMATGIFGSYAMEAGLISATFAAKGVPVRVMLMPYASEVSARAGSLAQAPSLIAKEEIAASSNKVFTNNRVKILSDGAFFAPAMKLDNPAYLDGRDGKWLTEPELLAEQIRNFWQAGLSLHIHVNGDAGLDTVLDAVENLPRNEQQLDQQIVLEHLGVSREDQIDRIKALGLLVSAQPNYLYVVSGKYAGKLLDKTQAAEMVRLGSLERANVPIALHSDLTMAPADPLFLAWIAVNRINMDGNLMAPEQRISVDTAMRAITIDAAKVIGLDDEIGSITVGKRADFAVLKQNPFETDPMDIKDIKVRGVVFEGKWFDAQ